MSYKRTEIAETGGRSPRSVSFRSILGTLVGKTVTLVETDAVEETPVDRYLTSAFTRAEVLSAGADYLLLRRSYTHHHGGNHTEPMRVFLPVEAIKRVSILEEETLIHI